MKCIFYSVAAKSLDIHLSAEEINLFYGNTCGIALIKGKCTRHILVINWHKRDVKMFMMACAMTIRLNVH